jgi:hypothetical protein
MIAEVNGKGILNRDKWMRVYKRGDTPTEAQLEAYLKLGGAVIELPKAKKVAKKAAKKVAKKATKKVAKK